MENKISKPTKEQIAAWKKEFEAKDMEVHVLKVGDKVAYLHSIDMQTLSLGMSLSAKNDIMGSVKAVLDNCWLGGDEAIKTVPKYFMGAMPFIEQLMAGEIGSMEKL